MNEDKFLQCPRCGSERLRHVSPSGDMGADDNHFECGDCLIKSTVNEVLIHAGLEPEENK